MLKAFVANDWRKIGFEANARVYNAKFLEQSSYSDRSKFRSVAAVCRMTSKRNFWKERALRRCVVEYQHAKRLERVQRRRRLYHDTYCSGCADAPPINSALPVAMPIGYGYEPAEAQRGPPSSDLSLTWLRGYEAT
eukprot:6206015-Pleurochrysis_carterae.AAC.1